ncbi:hypothetical protein [Polaromonas sp. YR568]|uniref:hypothetical protein n=1 Tax=Polaromonas sp. YR568 TaxID=1855301 RepID=UPI00398C00CE
MNWKPAIAAAKGNPMTRTARRTLSRNTPRRHAPIGHNRKTGPRQKLWHSPWRLDFLKSLPGKITGDVIRLSNTRTVLVIRQWLRHIRQLIELTWTKVFTGALLVLAFLLLYPDVVRSRLDAYEVHLDWPWSWSLLGGDSKGLILLDTPQVFTRGRLVNDRTKEADWLSEQLGRTNQLLREERFRGVQNRYTSDRKLGWQAAETQSAAPPADKSQAAPLVPSPGPIDEFVLASNYRETIRNKIMSTVLDDRHDIDGNSIYRLNFNATVLPRKGSKKVALLVASIREFRDDHSVSPDDRRKVYIELLHDWRKELESIAERGRNSAEKTLLGGSSTNRLMANQAQELNHWISEKLKNSKGVAFTNTPLQSNFSIERYIELANLAHYQLLKNDWEAEFLRELSSFESKVAMLAKRLAQEREKAEAQAYKHMDRSTKSSGPVESTSKNAQDAGRALTAVIASITSQASSPEEPAPMTANPIDILRSRIAAIARIRLNLQRISSESQGRKQAAARIHQLCRAQGRGDVSLLDALHPGIRLDDRDAEEASIQVKCPELLIPELAILDLAVLLNRPDISCGTPASEAPPADQRRKNELSLARLAALMQATVWQAPAELAWPCTGREEPLAALRELPASLEFLRKQAIAEWYAYYLKTQRAKIDANAGGDRCDCDPSRRCKTTNTTVQRLMDWIFPQPTQAAPRLSKSLELGNFYDFEVDYGTATIKVSFPPKPMNTQGLAEQLRSLMCRRAYAHTYAVFGNDTRLAQARAYASEVSAQQGGMRMSDAVSGSGMERSPLVLGFRDWAETSQASSVQEPARARFGWAILPQSSEGNGFVKAQQPESYAVSALVALPGWWKTAHLEVRTCWVAQSDLRPQQDLDKFCGSFAEADTNRFDIRLQSPSGNVDLMENLRFFVEKAPSIYLTAPPLVEAGRPGAIRIPGTRLWRSPVVLLGEQQADSIEVLPDMKGIIAKFNCVHWPVVTASHSGGLETEVALVVTTSEGSIPDPAPRAKVLPFQPKRIQAGNGQMQELDCDIEEKNRKVATSSPR